MNTPVEQRLRSACEGKRLLILDYDGTLAYLAIDWTSVRRDLERVASPYGFVSRFSPLWDEIGRFRDQFGARQLPILFRVLARHEEIGVEGQQPRPDIVEAVGNVIEETGINAVVLSLNLRKTVDTGLKRLGLRSVSAIMGADDVLHWKPDPEGIHALLARSGMSPSDTLFVGDSSRDSGAAAAAGVDFMRV